LTNGVEVEPYGWNADEINGYLARKFRSCIDIPFQHGTLPANFAFG